DQDETRRGRTIMSEDYRPVPNKANRYLQDRSAMNTDTFCGIAMKYFQAQDMCATEGAGPIQDRTQEHLASTDRGVLAVRNLLLRAVRDVQEGRDPAHVLRDPASNRFDDMVTRNDILPSNID